MPLLPLQRAIITNLMSNAYMSDFKHIIRIIILENLEIVETQSLKIYPRLKWQYSTNILIFEATQINILQAIPYSCKIFFMISENWL